MDAIQTYLCGVGASDHDNHTYKAVIQTYPCGVEASPVNGCSVDLAMIQTYPCGVEAV